MNAPAAARGDRDLRWPGQLAAIDLGSNSFRLEIGQAGDGRYRRIDYLKETVRLGAGLDDAGLLSDEAAERGLECLARFARRLEGFQTHQVRAVATQTLREARNRDAFLAKGQVALGQPIEVISGREEARLIYAGVARLQPSTVPRLVVDIGGRSTEMILGRGTTPLRAESFQVGSVSLSMRHFENGAFTAAAFRDAQVAAAAELEEAALPFAPRHWREALGSSGTVGAVSQVLAAANVTDGRVTPEALRWLMQRCIDAGSAEKLDLPGLRADRRAVIGGGLAILYTLATRFGIDELLPARGALRQGVIFDLAARHADDAQAAGASGDVRAASVRELQRRFMVDAEHAARVGRLAETFLAALLPNAPAEPQRELRWAADLHEAGMMISHHDHHRHSAYVLSHADAAGFSQSQLRRIADLVLGQRGGLRKLEAQLQQPGFARTLLSLRLAVIVCHARDEIGAAAPVSIEGGSDKAPRIAVRREAAETQPQLALLLKQETDAWAKSGALAPELAVVG